MHLHIHVHPRRTGDGMLKVYPQLLPPTDQQTRDEYAARIREHMQEMTG
jgi:histidine triad (HIT) family protein